MSKDVVLSGKWKNGQTQVTVNVPLIIFNEDDNTVVYCPALDLSGYGNSEDEARHSFETVLSEYFMYTINKQTLGLDLIKHGWTIKKNLSRGAIPPSMQQLLSTNEDFKKIFNTRDFRKTETSVNIPAFA